jgi:hypothetical protein
MYLKRLLFWAVTFCLIFLYAIFFEWKDQRKENTSEKENIAVLFPFQNGEAHEIQITMDNKRAVLKKQRGSWIVSFPPESQIKNELIDSLISSIKETSIIKVVEENPGNPGQYGLDNPGFTLAVTLKGKTQPVTLLFGNNSPAGVSVYAMIKGENKVVLTGNYILFSVKNFMENI